jgi:hypothetical protein
MDAGELKSIRLENPEACKLTTVPGNLRLDHHGRRILLALERGSGSLEVIYCRGRH